VGGQQNQSGRSEEECNMTLNRSSPVLSPEYVADHELGNEKLVQNLFVKEVLKID
jgi:hypothetical protein